MHSGEFSAEDEPMADLNLIPLIDIALTLVIILMLTTVFVRDPGLRLNLPETVTREGAPQTSQDTTIAVTKTGGFYLNGKARTAAELGADLKALATQNADTRVLINGDRDALYGRMAEVMDVARQAGLRKLVFQTEPKTPGTQPAP